MSSDPRLQNKMSGGAVLLPRPSCSANRPGKIITRPAKRSGVSHIRWDQAMYAWRVYYRVKGKESLHNFPVRRYRKSGFSEIEADQAALNAARAARADLVKQGIIKEKEGGSAKSAQVDPTFVSSAPGIYWLPKDQKWRIQIRAKLPGVMKKVIDGGSFKPTGSSPAEIIEARSRAEARHADLCFEYGIQWVDKEVKDATQFVKHPCAVTGVAWSPSENAWHARIPFSKKQIHKRFRPLDNSEAEITRSRLEAEAWVSDMKQKKQIEKKAAAAK
eukprot:TRINITY_DN4218_c0_g1_i7.p1 TRINITY_DN4218_c0_g1~~TRINITY_DN4218_c0_g1_i7.p1  ORF type:complete len:291 (-),score=70.82 TRINITY_DN4218_c0_g1_i7:410-1231(-)